MNTYFITILQGVLIRCINEEQHVVRNKTVDENDSLDLFFYYSFQLKFPLFTFIC